jgi:hypothetical protein
MSKPLRPAAFSPAPPFPCELLKFGAFSDNQLDVYLAPAGDQVVVDSGGAYGLRRAPF